MKLSLVAGLILLAPALAFAQQNCDKPRNDFDGLYCLNKIYAQTDADLNQAYKELSEALPEADKNTLKSRQIAWIKQRNATCSRKMDDGFYVNLGCATKTTKERLEVLQERTRECKSSGCLPSKL
jgi:uncharacterized protein YecT (DUF1311 family)